MRLFLKASCDCGDKSSECCEMLNSLKYNRHIDVDGTEIQVEYSTASSRARL